MSWSCSVCTFLNEALFLQCSICGTPKSETSIQSSDWSCAQCTFINQPSSTNCSICQYPQENTQNNAHEIDDNKNKNNTDSKSAGKPSQNTMEVDETKCESSEHTVASKKRSRAQFENDESDDDADDHEDDYHDYGSRKIKRAKLSHASDVAVAATPHSTNTNTNNTNSTNPNSHQQRPMNVEEDDNKGEEVDNQNRVFPPITKQDKVPFDEMFRYKKDILRRIGESWKQNYPAYRNPMLAQAMDVYVSGMDATHTRNSSPMPLLDNRDEYHYGGYHGHESIGLDDFGLAIVGRDDDSPFVVFDVRETQVSLTRYMFTHPLHVDSEYKHLQLDEWTVEGSNDLQTWSLIQGETRDAANITYCGGDYDTWRCIGEDTDTINRSLRLTFVSRIVDHDDNTSFFTKFRFSVNSCYDTRMSRRSTASPVLPLQRIRLYGNVRRRVYKVARENELRVVSFASIGGGHIVGDPQSMLNLCNEDRGVQHLECEAFEGEIEHFQCQLKPYQKRCLTWMLDREENGNRFGVHGGMCALEMGLGKTVQIIALLLLQRMRKGKERTLILTPLSLIDQWMSEIDKFAPDTFTCINYYGQKRKRITARDFEQCDLIFSSFDTFSKSVGRLRNAYDDYDSQEYWTAHDPQLIFTLPPELFTRVVIDESHEIKQPHSNRAQITAVFADTKRIKYRWCLTGTPFSDDMPVNLSASCYMLGMSRSDFVGALSLTEAEKNKHVYTAANDAYDDDGDGDNDGGSRRRKKKKKKKKKNQSGEVWGHIDDEHYVEHKLRPFLAELMLRRTKQQVSSDDSEFLFPEKHEAIVYVDLNDDEAVIYHKLAADVKQKYCVYKRSNNVMRHYVYLVQMLTKLRKLCDHPGIVYAAQQESGDAENVGANVWNAFDGDVLTKLKADIVRRINEMESLLDYECPVCLETTALNGGLLAVCGHLFCVECLKLMIQQNSLCGLCRTECRTKDIICIEKVLKSEKLDAKHKEEYRFWQQEQGNGDDANDADAEEQVENGLDVSQQRYHEIMLKYTNTETSSSKMDALVDRLRYIEQNHAGDKMIVFSNFSQVFSIISKRLKTENMQHLQFDSTLTRSKRKKVLEQFASSSQHNVLLLSTKCASVGLNLICANHVIFIDPRVNPALDNQAVGRCWRLGQNKTVHVTRLITRNTVEHQMLSLLHDKQASEQGQQNVNLKQNAKLKAQDFDMIFGYEE